MIFSVGLMRLMSYRDVMACFRSFQSATGGDALVSYCLWRRGFAFTDPGPLVRHMYDPYYHVFGGKSGQGFLWDPIGMISHGRCPTKCRWLLRNALSLHLKGRHFRNWRVGRVRNWRVWVLQAWAGTAVKVTGVAVGAGWWVGVAEMGTASTSAFGSFGGVVIAVVLRVCRMVALYDGKGKNPKQP